MKKLFLLLLGLIFVSSLFSQSYIGRTKKDILNTIKDDAVKIEKPVFTDDGFYNITVKFQSNSNVYSFTDNDICYFYIIIEKYYLDNYLGVIKYYDERYLRVLGEKDVWKEAKGDSFVYIWIVCNINRGVQYIIYLPKENYESNRFTYLKTLLE